MQPILTDIARMNVGIRSKNSRCVPVSFAVQLHGGGAPLLILVIILPNAILYLSSDSTSYQSENIGTLPPLACLRLPTCDVDSVADGDPPQPLHSCWQRPHCPPLASTVHFGGVKECIIIINPSNHNVDLNKEKYEHYKCLIIFTFSCPLLYPAHPCCFRPTVMSGRSTTQPCLLYLAQFRCFDIRFSESINVKVECLCHLDTLVRVCSPPVIRTESSSSGMAQASLQIFIDIEVVRD